MNTTRPGTRPLESQHFSYIFEKKNLCSTGVVALPQWGGAVKTHKKKQPCVNIGSLLFCSFFLRKTYRRRIRAWAYPRLATRSWFSHTAIYTETNVWWRGKIIPYEPHFTQRVEGRFFCQPVIPFMKNINGHLKTAERACWTDGNSTYTHQRKSNGKKDKFKETKYLFPFPRQPEENEWNNKKNAFF